MNRVARIVVMMVVLVLGTYCVEAQKKIDEERMLRDIEVTENILSTLIKQQFEKRAFFPMEIRAEYREGHGVTYRLPYEFNGPMVWGLGNSSDMAVLDGRGFSYSFEFPGEQNDVARVYDGQGRIATENVTGLTTTRSRRVNVDSVREASTEKTINACKEFLADYGDLLTQLSANEKIMITNRGDGDRIWYGAFVNNSRPSYISLEASKGDITQLKQGKMTRDQFMKSIKVINSVMDDELQPDLELLTSIFNRLYRKDLSKTYFTEENLYYEKLKDYGVIYYMQVYSSNQMDYNRRWVMPTLGLEGLTTEERDKKVKELYPQFEKDFKADMLEYGRTLKSLTPEELLVFNVRLTKCDGCGIPSTLEFLVKSDVLKDYAAGKLSKEAALAKVTVKKTGNQ
jgi:hypothetical protein